MRTTVTYRQIWLIAYPIILGSIAQTVINVTDTAFLGRVGETALAASAVGGVLYHVFIMIAFGFATGTQIIVARRDGEGNHKQIGPVIEQAGYFLIFASVILFMLLQVGGRTMLDALLQSEPVTDETHAYLDIRSYGLFVAFMNMSYRAFFVGIGRTRVISLVTIVMAVVNVILDYILIFGKLGLEPMGIRGAALASLCAEVSGLAFFTVYTLLGDYRVKYNLYKFSRFSMSLFKRLMYTASPVMLQFFISLAGWFAFFLFVEKMGEHDLAVSQVVRSAYIVLLIPVWGFAAATNTMVSNLLGQGRKNEVVSLIYKIQRFTVMVILPLVGLFMLFPHVLVSLYGGDELLRTDSVRVLMLIAPAALFMGFNFTMFSGVSGTGKTIVSLVIEAITISSYIAVVWFFVMARKYPIEIVWTTEYVYCAILGGISWIYLSTGRWKESRV